MRGFWQISTRELSWRKVASLDLCQPSDNPSSLKEAKIVTTQLCLHREETSLVLGESCRS